MNTKTLLIAIVVIIAALGGWYYLSGSATPQDEESMEVASGSANDEMGSTTTSGTPSTGTSINPAAGTPSAVTITFTNSGFSPKSVTIAQGQTVTWVNESSEGMWVASAAHPTHTVYSGTSLAQHCPDTANDAFDACTAVAAGSSYSFTFDKAGTWNYHNHVDASKTGTVIVTAGPNTQL